jgi:hypothetical protein
MRIKNKIILIVLVVIGVGCVSWFVFCAFKLFSKSAERMRYYSAMSWLNAAIRKELDDYYDAKGQYPTELADLSIPFPGDGAEPKMLNNFVYSTDGSYYEITWEIQYGSGINTHKEHAVRGQMIFTEYYINGQLHSRTEFSEGKIISKTLFKNGKVVSEEKTDTNAITTP